MSEKNLSFGKVVKGGFWLYLDTIIVSFIGYLYWLIIGKMGGPAVIGEASTASSLSGIFNVLVFFGIPTGLQRFIGKCMGTKDFAGLKRYFLSSILFTTIVFSATSLSLFLFRNILSEFIGLESIFILLVAIHIFLSGVTSILRSFFISFMLTKELFIFDVLGNIFRFLSGVYLVYSGWGASGAFMGFIISSFIILLLRSIYVYNELRKLEGSLSISWSSTREVLEAGFVSWLPAIISTIGIQSGILIMYGVSGSIDTGIYFIAYAMASVLLALPNSILGLLLPVLSGIPDGRKAATWRTIRITLAISSPLAAAFVSYGDFVISLIGSEYMSGALMLSILSLSIPFACLTGGFSSYVYSKALYKIVFLLGMASSLTRVISYLFFVPLYDGIGASISFLLGYIPPFILSVLYSKRMGFIIFWKDYLLGTFIPLLISLPMILLSTPWFIGIWFIPLVSFFIFARIGIIRKEDLRDIASSLLPSSIIEKMLPKVYPILELLFGKGE
ncbi:MAG: oligosaccharide flippase family protein [Candidatus Asgardarchaeia archaeon]